jgi:TonB-linked SusC/RagA family outer membrane protein
MRLTVFISILTIFQSYAIESYSQKTRISLDISVSKLVDVMDEIENRSEFYFLFNEKLIDTERIVSLNAKDKRIDDILDEIFKGTNVVYTITDRKIILAPDFLSESSQQQIRISGTVKDASGLPLPGVTIVIKGTTQGTVTDVNGIYSIQVPSIQTVLQFSFVGFGTKEISVGSQTEINVILEESIQQMDEVIITALGIKRDAKSIGYAATSVNTSEINNPASVNFGNNLLGKVAGVNVTALPSGAGGTSKIRIRGQSSFNAHNTPLIVVNGIPINNIPATSSNPNAQESDLGDGLQSINPDDIESMTVLKGASAAALYGYRAKDGVIIITTKTGANKTGLGIEFKTSFTAEQALDFTDFQYEYGQGEFGIRPASVSDARSSGGWSFGTKFDGELVWAIDGKQHPYVPFKDRIKAFYETGTNITNSLSLSGGNESGSYRFSVANTNAANIVPNSVYNKRIFDVALNYKFGENLTAMVNINYSVDYNKNPPFGGQRFSIPNSIMTMANSIDPRWLRDSYIDPDTGNETRWTRFLDRTNWYWSAFKQLEENKKDRIYGNVLLRYQLTEWLYIQGRIGQDKFFTYHQVNNPTGTANNPPVAVGYNGSFSQNKDSFREINMDFLVGANKTFGAFGIDATFGGNSMDQSRSSLATTVTNFYIRDLYTIGNGQIKNPTYSYSGKKVNSLYGSINFSFNDFLFLNATGRNDWFSTLNPESNNYFYPSVSSSFLFSQAFSSIMPSWLDYGKLRMSYAEVGGDTEPYRDNLYYSMGANTYNGYAYGSISTGTSPNAYLRPLKVKEVEAGMELILFDRRVSLDIAAYRKNTIDEILNVDISNASGYSTTVVNIGRLKNEGIEALLKIVPIRNNNLNWETGINYTYNISEVLELAEGQPIINIGSAVFVGRLSHEVGKPLASLRGFDYLRNSEGKIITIDGRFQQGKEITFGSAVPKHIGGFLNTFNYKKIRVFTQVDFKAGHKLISDTNWNMLRSGHHKKSLPGREGGVIFDAVNLDGSPNTKAVEAETFYTDYSGKRITTESVYNASFVRWRTLSLGYDMSHFVSNTIIKSFVVNANVNNVLMIKKYTENIDPESVSQVSDRQAGLESISLPTTRSYSISLSFKF